MQSVTPGDLFVAALITFLVGTVAPVVLPGRSGKWRFAVSHLAALVGALLSAAAALPAMLGQGYALAFSGVIPLLHPTPLALDATSAFFVLVISGLAAVAAVYALGDAHLAAEAGGWQGSCLNLFILGMIGVVTAAAVFPFLVAWELMALASFFLVMANYDQPGVTRAGTIYLVMTHLGTLFIIAAFLLLSQAGGGMDFDRLRIGAASLSADQRSLVFVLALIGFGTKGGLVPLHVWLPRAHPVAPSHVSALMSGVMVKTAIYGLIRFGFDFLAADLAPPAWWGALLLAAGAISALVGVLNASAEGHVKRLLAFSTVENIGLIAMGLGTALWARAAGDLPLAGLALTAALYHTLGHALMKGLLFLGAGALHHSTGTLNLEEMGGLIRRMPRTAIWFLAGALALAALPPMVGLVSEWLLLQAFLRMALALPASLAGGAGLAAAATLALTGALVAATMVKLYGTAFLGLPRSTGAANAHEVPWPMRLAMAVLALSCLLAALAAGAIVPVLGRISTRWLGPTAGGLLGPGVGIRTATATGPGAANLAVGLLLLLLLALVALGWLVARRYGRLRWRRDVTWTCGIIPSPRMQYSAAGYTSPLTLMFRKVLWPTKEVRAQPGDSPLFPGTLVYTGGVPPIYETYLYRPALRLVIALSERLRHLQMGDTQVYLIYLFVTLLLVLILAR